MRSFHFESINKITPKYEFSNKQIGLGLWTLNIIMHLKTQQKLINACRNSSMKEILKVIKDPFKPLFVGTRAFKQTTKKGYALFVYIIPTPDLRTQQHEILIHYNTTKMFLKIKT